MKPTFATLTLLALLANAPSSHAQGIWTGQGGNDLWDQQENWQGDTLPGAFQPITFGDAARYAIDLGGGRKPVGNLGFTSANAYTLGNGTLELGEAGTITASAGPLSILADVEFKNGAANANGNLYGTMTVEGKITAANLDIAKVGETLTISGTAANAITGTTSINGGSVIVNKAGASAQGVGIGRNLLFRGDSGSITYQGLGTTLSRITLQRNGTITAHGGLSITGSSYVQFNPGWKLTIDTGGQTAVTNVHWGLASAGSTGTLELEALSNIDFTQNGSGIRNQASTTTTTGEASFIKSGAGTLTYASTVVNSYSGATTISGGAIALGNLAQLGVSGNAASNLLLKGGELRYTGLSAGSGRGFTVEGSSRIAIIQETATVEFSGEVLGGGVLTKQGDGTLLLSGDGSARTGTTAVAAGTLLVSQALGGTTEVEASATVGGNGTLGGLLVKTGGTVTPGSSPGVLNVSGNATLEGGSHYNWQVASINPDAGDQSLAGTLNGWDLLSVEGDLLLSGVDTSTRRLNLNLSTLSDPATSGELAGFSLSQTHTWKFAEADRIVLNALELAAHTDYSDYFSLNLAPANGSDGWDGDLPALAFRVVTLDNGHELYLQIEAIPEPSAFMLCLGAGLLAAGTRVARRRKSQTPY
ncbi:MAG TPA: autotransporter-associated beta strand repeat-containing protein [Chthoniobacteraceae bacterium]|nr:autotransporter-associated beta strand repeat-containing protein [Chthoniobacteraceae bacterium]